MILFVLAFASNFVFTWVIPIACACVAIENQALEEQEQYKSDHII